jgi:hypothetical protein
MPQASLWVQYSLIGILVLSTAIMASALYRLWRDLLKWMDKQDEKRTLERDKQREWEAAQNKERDLRWQDFLKAQQERWLEQDVANSIVLEKLVSKIEELSHSLNNHDTWAKANSGK